MERLNNCTQKSRINRVFATSTFLYPALQKLEFQKKNGHEDYYYRKYLPKDKNLFEYDYLLSPVNIDNTHWILMVIDLVFLELIIYDSLIRDNDNPMYQKVFDIFTKLTSEICDEIGAEVLRGKQSWKRKVCKNLAQQRNDKDCGAFVCKYAKSVVQRSTLNFDLDPFLLRNEILTDLTANDNKDLQKPRRDSILKKDSNRPNRSSIESLQEEVLLSGMQFKQGVPGDGNCFFHAVADQLKRIGEPGYSAADLRKLSVNFLKTNPLDEEGAHLANYLEDETWEQYLSRMSRSGQYADGILIYGALNALNRPLSIFLSIGEKGLRLLVAHNEDGKKQEPLILGHLAEAHYYSLEPSISQLKPAMQKEVESTRKRKTKECFVEDSGSGLAKKTCRNCKERYYGQLNDINYIYPSGMCKFYSTLDDICENCAFKVSKTSDSEEDIAELFDI